MIALASTVAVVLSILVGVCLLNGARIILTDDGIGPGGDALSEFIILLFLFLEPVGWFILMVFGARNLVRFVARHASRESVPEVAGRGAGM